MRSDGNGMVLVHTDRWTTMSILTSQLTFKTISPMRSDGDGMLSGVCVWCIKTGELQCPFRTSWVTFTTILPMRSDSDGMLSGVCSDA